MGLASFAAGAIATAPNLAALQSTQDLVIIGRYKCDAIRAIGAGGAVAIGSVDDGTNANAKCYVHAQASSDGTTRSLQMVIPGQTGPSTNQVLLAKWPAGRFVVFVMYHLSSSNTNGYMLFDDTGTNTPLDGLSRATSPCLGTATRVAPFPSIANNGAIRVNVCASGATAAQVVDALYCLSSLPTVGTEDALPTAGMTGLLTGWLFDDTIGSTTFVNLKSGGSVLTAVPSTGVTLIAGGAWGTPTFTPTTVTGTPASPACLIGGTVQLVPVTQDQSGNTGTLTPATRTYSYTITGAAGIVTVSGSGLVTGLASGTTQITVADTATGGGSATHWIVTVTVSAVAGTVYDWSSSAPSIASVTTGLATEVITDVAAGPATVTITRHGTAASVTLSVLCAGPGVGNEPSGMTPGINTGDMTTAPTQVLGGPTWNEGSIIVTPFSNFTTAADASVGTLPNNIMLCPDGPGLRQQYLTSLHGGNAPVSFGCPIAQPSGTLQGELYISCLVRTINWSNRSVTRGTATAGPQIIGVKILEPRCGQASENHAITGTSTSDTDEYLQFLQQGVPVTGANQNYPREDISPFSGISTYVPHADLQFPSAAWRLIQFVIGQETVVATSGDAYVKYWVGAAGAVPTLAYDSTTTGALDGQGTWLAQGAFNLLCAGSVKGWPFVMFNSTYGGLGDQFGPPQQMFLDINQLYASSK